MNTSPLVQTQPECTEAHCRIRRAADVLAYYASGATPSPWYLTPDHHVLATVDGQPYPVHSPQLQMQKKPSQAILDSEYLTFAQPQLLIALSQVLLERAETHKLRECYYCKTQHEDCPSLTLSDMILSMPEQMRQLPPEIPCPNTPTTEIQQ